MKRILVIEDEPDLLGNLTTILRLEKYRPLGAANGRIGLEMAKNKLPDLILCDVTMPELDGYGVLQGLRADPATESIPFIFLTARGDKPEQRAGMNMGADDYLTKPFTKADLLQAISARLLRQAQKPGLEFKPDFNNRAPLEMLGLTPRVAEVLLWVAQGKTNADVATILGISESTVKKHVLEIFQTLQVETRSAATLRALEALSGPKQKRPAPASL